MIFRMLIVFAIALIFAASGAHASQANKFEGIYKGSMQVLGETQPIPLAFSLVLTGEYIQIPKGQGVFDEQQVIDASFLIDDEAGPFAFWKTSYNLDKNQIDLRYNRPSGFTTVETPSSFRLIGQLDASGAISGRVVSGPGGPIGTFKVTRSTDAMLEAKAKYVGTWYGDAITVPEGERIPYELTVENSYMAQPNPPDMEFDYTVGRLGHYSWRGNKASVTKIIIDYLRRKMFLVAPETAKASTETIECDLPTGNREIMTGAIYSTYGGKRATLELRKAQ